MVSSAALLTTETERRRLLRIALNLTEGTAIAPQEDERKLLEQFVQGALSIDQVLEQLEQEPTANDQAA